MLPALSGSPGLPAKLDAEGLPAFLDRECDIEIPVRVFSGVILSNSHRELVRALTEEERAKVESRALALQNALAPFSPAEKDQVEADVGAMLSGFRALRQEGDNGTAMVEVTCAVIQEFPRWAIGKACIAIAQGRVELDPRYAPNDGQIYKAVADIVQPYIARLRTARDLLAAPVMRRFEKPPALPGRPPEPPGDGNHAQRVLTEIAARKAERDEVDTTTNQENQP